MRIVIQRVSHASVTIDGVCKSAIKEGFMILVGKVRKYPLFFQLFFDIFSSCYTYNFCNLFQGRFFDACDTFEGLE